MPEGDTIFKAATVLHRALAGRRIIRAELRVPEHATSDLAGQSVSAVVSRGKHLLIRTDAGWTVHTHLKMEGSWRLMLAGRRPRDRDDRIRVVIETEACTAVGEELGIVELLSTNDEARVLGHLGPDLLGEDWDADEALRRLGADPDRAIGEALLDQRVMAGLGNVYRCELCFLRGIHPGTRVGDVRDRPGLVALARRVLWANRTTGNQVTTGDTRPGHRQWVYGRAGDGCRRCGTRIERDPGSEGDRVTYWCPSCQPSAGKG